MPLTVSSVEDLQTYIRGVLGRAEHHAHNVDEVILTIAGAVLWRAEGDLRVMAQDSGMKNVLWLEVGGTRYAISYNHEAATVEVRQNSTHGPVLRSFTNTSAADEVKAFFGAL